MKLLLFLCLLLPATKVLSEEMEGSADDSDDEDLRVNTVVNTYAEHNPDMDKATGAADSSDQFTVIVVCVAVSVVALSAAVIVAILLVRRNTHMRQQGVYSVPAEQGQKGAVV